MPCYGGSQTFHKRSRITTHGFRRRKLSKSGRKILNSRRKEGRKRVAV